MTVTAVQPTAAVDSVENYPTGQYHVVVPYKSVDYVVYRVNFVSPEPEHVPASQRLDRVFGFQTPLYVLDLGCNVAWEEGWHLTGLWPRILKGGILKAAK